MIKTREFELEILKIKDKYNGKSLKKIVHFKIPLYRG